MSTETPTELKTVPPNEGLPATQSTRAAPAARRTEWQLNVRLLIWTLVILGVAAPSLFFWYRYQINRNASAVLDRARKHYDEEQWQAAAMGFFKYLQLRPDDAEAKLRLAEAAEKSPIDGEEGLRRVIGRYLTAVNANPENHEARFRLAELLISSQRYKEAKTQLETLLTASPDDVRCLRMQIGIEQSQLGDTDRRAFRALIGNYQDALQRHSGDVTLSVGYAQLLRQRGNDLEAKDRPQAVEWADAAIDAMVKSNPDDKDALLARFRYRNQYGLPDARTDLERARAVAPDDPEVLLTSAVADAESNQPAAEQFANRLLEVAPDERRSYLAVAELRRAWGQSAESIAVLKAGLDQLGENDLELNRSLLRLLLSLGKAHQTEATSVLERFEQFLRKAGHTLKEQFRTRFNEEIEVARAHLDLLEGDAAAALPVLKRLSGKVTAIGDVDETSNEKIRRLRLLAQTYSQVGLHDLSADAYEEVLRVNPFSRQVHVLAGDEWRAAGDLEQAVGHYEQATQGDPPIAVAWLGLAQARMELEARKANAKGRDWSGVEFALQQARTSLKENPALLSLEIASALARGDKAAALEQLQKLLPLESQEPSTLPRLALMFEEVGEPGQADRALEVYRESGATNEQYIVARTDLLRRRKLLTETLKLLEEGAESGNPRLLRRLIALEIETGAMRSARTRLWQWRNRDQELLAAGKLKSFDLWAYETAADLALIADDTADLRACAAQLKKIEGQDGALWRYLEALALLEESASTNVTREKLAATVRDVNLILLEIERRRPTWAQLHVLRGRLAQRMGRMAEAAAHYEKALQFGARNLTAMQWLISALYSENRYADAAQYVQQSGRIAAVSRDLSSLSVPTGLLQAGRVDDALRVARATAELRPNDSLAQLWLGQTLALSGKPAEAEAAFRKGIELAPTSEKAWAALLWFFARERRIDDARKTLRELTENVTLSKYKQQLVMAQGADMIGDRALAEKHYLAAIEEERNNPRLLEEVARFYFRFDQDQSLSMYLKALEIDPKSVEARRGVALLWGIRGSQSDFDKAIGMLSEAATSDGASRLRGGIDDRRLQATLYLVRGGEENFTKAADLAAKVIAAQEKPRPNDRLVMAKACEELGRLDESREQLTALVRENDEPAFQGILIEYLTRHDLFDEAAVQLTRFEEREPDSVRGLELRVRWLDRSGRIGEIEQAVDRFIAARNSKDQSDSQQSATLRLAADLLTRAKLYDEAEKRLRELARLPQGYEILAIWLAERGRAAEAIALCLENANPGQSARGASILVRVLTISAGRSALQGVDTVAAENFLTAALQPGLGGVDLLIETGVLRTMQGRDAEAVQLYEQALNMAPDNVAAMNNLALSLVEIPERREDALRHIDKALGAVARSYELLDTRAMVLIGSGRVADGREILEQICAPSQKNPRYRFHLAIALALENEMAQAQSQLARAMQDGLAGELLTPAERRELDKLTSVSSASGTN